MDTNEPRNNNKIENTDGVDSGISLLESLNNDLEEFDSDSFKEFFTYAGSGYEDEFGGEAEDTVEKGRLRERQGKKSFISAFFYLIGQKFKSGGQGSADEDEKDTSEPRNMSKIAARYARSVPSMIQRSRVAFVLCVLMAFFTVSFEFAGKTVIFGDNIPLLVGVLMLMQLLVMLLCLEVPVVGVMSAVRGRVGAETLIAVSFIVTFFDGILIAISNSAHNGLPFLTISAFSAVFGLRGMADYNVAMRDSIRVLTKVKEPWGLTVDSDSIEDRDVLRKQSGATKGFYNNLIRRDICEHAYSYAAPIILIGILVLASLVSLKNRNGADFPHVLAAIAAVSASFSALSSFSMPFKIVASQSRRGGCAVAGWQGADKIFDTDGVYITDNDLFPNGTVQIAGVRIVGNVSRYKAVEYAGSLVTALGSDLVEPFRQLMREDGATAMNVLNFTCYDGGVGGMVRSDNVLLGTASFMEAMEVRLPEDAPRKQVLFLSVNSRLAAMFAVKYKLSESVRSCLASLKKTKLTLIFALKDVLITPRMLQKKSGIPVNGTEYIPLEDSFRIAKDEDAASNDSVAIVNKGSFIAVARTAARAAKLRQIALISTAVSIFGTAAGMLLVFFMCWNGPLASVTVWGTALFMLMMYIITVILANLARR